jgi:hypothetical protein
MAGAPTFDLAVSVRHWDWSETSQTVWLFTRAHGLVRALAKGSKRPNAPFSGGVELLTLGEAGVLLKPNADLHLMTEWDPREAFPHLRRTLRAHYAALHMADLVQHMVLDRDPHPELFDALVRELEALSREGHEAACVLRFQVDALRAVGLMPVLDTDAPASARWLVFDPDRHRVVGQGEAGWRVRPDTARLIAALGRRDQAGDNAPGARATGVRDDDATIQRAGRLLSTYIRHILGREPPTARLVFPPIDPTRSPFAGARPDASAPARRERATQGPG